MAAATSHPQRMNFSCLLKYGSHPSAHSGTPGSADLKRKGGASGSPGGTGTSFMQVKLWHGIAMMTDDHQPARAAAKMVPHTAPEVRSPCTRSRWTS